MSYRPSRRQRARDRKPPPCFVHTAAAAPADTAAAAANSSASFTMKEDHKESALKATSHVTKNLREYRNRMEEIMDWFEENYPDYYKQVVFKLTPEMKADPSLIQVAITTKQRETFVMTS